MSNAKARRLLTFLFPILILADALYCQFFGEMNGNPAVAPFNSFGWAFINWSIFWLLATSVIDSAENWKKLAIVLVKTIAISFVVRFIIVYSFSEISIVSSSIKYLAKLVLLSIAYGGLVRVYYLYYFYPDNNIEDVSKRIDNAQQRSHIDTSTFEFDSEICWARACGNYVEIFTPTKKLIQRQSLNSIARELAKNGLIQVHRSFLVNRAVMVKLLPKSNGAADLELTNGERVPVSKRYLPEIKNLLSS